MSWARVLVVAVIVAGSIAAGAPPAASLDRGTIKVSEDQPVAVKEYPALVGNPANTGTVYMNWATCGRAHTSCDLIKVELDPGDLTLFTVRAILTWPNPKTDPDDRSGNDLNIAVWDINPDVPYCCRNQRTTEPAKHPEVVQFLTDAPEPSETHLIVDNTSGVNNGYTLKVEIVTIDLGAGYDTDRFNFSGPSGRQSGGAGAFNGSPFDDLPEPTVEEATSPDRTVLVPGPDGTLEQQTIPVLSARATRPPQPLSPVIIAAVVLALIALLGGGYLLFKRRRARRAAEPRPSYTSTLGI